MSNIVKKYKKQLVKKINKWSSLEFRKKAASFLTIFSMVTTMSMPFLLYPSVAGADTMGPKSPATAVDNGGGAAVWANPSNVFSSNDSLAVATLNFSAGPATTNYLKATNFGFTIPAGATINGIVANIERNGDLGNGNKIFDNSLKLIKNGTISGSDKADALTQWPSSDTVATYGSMTDLWGATWTASDINASNFGIAISAIKTGGGNSNKIAAIDYISLTVYYTPLPTTGTIVITKVANGGTGTFQFNGTGGISSSFTIDTAQNPAKTFLNVPAGSHSVTEVNLPAGWDFTSLQCVDPTSNSTVNGMTATINLAAGETVNCTYTNTKRASITVHKDVVSPNGGLATDDHEFTAMLNGSDPKTIKESVPAVYDNLVPGQLYAITETQDQNYGDISYSTDCVLTPTPGQNASCTITNKQKQGTLTVTKIVQNHGIKNSIASDFTMEVEGNNVSNPSFPGNSQTGTSVTLDPGSYSVGESGPSGYAMSLSQNCSGTINSNENVSCTVTNSDIPAGQGAITVIKEVINDNGGILESGDFNALLKITKEEGPTQGAASGQANFLTPGNYTVSEDSSSALYYTQTGISCTDGTTTVANGNITVADQQAWVCTVTNNDDAPSLTLIKQVVNDNGGTQSASAWTLTAAGPTGFSGVGPTVNNGTSFDAGTYTLSESGPSGYTASSWVCIGGSQEGSSIALSLGQSATCTITNDDQPGTLIIKKIVINDNQGEKTASQFSFTKTGDETIYPFIQNGENSLLGEKTLTVNVGTYTITETTVAGYTTSYQNCSNITVANGQTQTCTITNNDFGDIDGDGIGDATDNCPSVSNPDQLDTDHDGLGNVCDTDDDNDNQTDVNEISCGSDPLDAASKSLDTDGDNIPNCVDTDDDGEGVLDGVDNCPINANPDQADTDHDGVGNVCDSTPAPAPAPVSGGGGGGGGGGGRSIFLSYTLTSSAGANGSVTPLGTMTVSAGSNSAFTINPDAGFQIGNVIVDGVSLGPVSNYTFNNISSNHTLSATFTGIAGVSTVSTQVPGSGQEGGNTNTSNTGNAGAQNTTGDQSGNLGGETPPSVAGDQTSNVSENQEPGQSPAEDTGSVDNQTAAIGQTTGLGAFLAWLGSHWLWWLLLLILLLIAYYLYREWKKNQNKGKI